MHDKNTEQSAKDVLEDIKKVMHNKSYNNIANQELDSETSYFQHDEDDESLDFEDKNEEFKSSHPNESFAEAVKIEHENIKEQENYGRESLLSKENIDASSAEIQHLVEEVQKSRNKECSITLEELAIKLLEPKLKECLNNHLHNLIKEIVEKEIRHIVDRQS